MNKIECIGLRVRQSRQIIRNRRDRRSLLEKQSGLDLIGAMIIRGTNGNRLMAIGGDDSLSSGLIEIRIFKWRLSNKEESK